MAVNLDKPLLWESDVIRSVEFYNEWFVNFVPQAYQTNRVEMEGIVEEVFDITSNMTNLSTDVLKENPHILPTLRMSTVPPIARDRLIGLAGVSSSLVKNMEENLAFGYSTDIKI